MFMDRIKEMILQYLNLKNINDIKPIKIFGNGKQIRLFVMLMMQPKQ